MKRTDQDQLLNEILDGEGLPAFRQASLERTLASIRRQRRRQRVVRACVLASLPVLLVWGVLLSRVPKSTDRQATFQHRGATTGVKLITDEELFALFPGRPMALIGKPGQQQFVFLDNLAAIEQP